MNSEKGSGHWGVNAFSLNLRLIVTQKGTKLKIIDLTRSLLRSLNNCGFLSSFCSYFCDKYYHFCLLTHPRLGSTHTLSEFSYLIHELYPTNHHSFQQLSIDGNFCLLLPFQHSAICLLSNLKSVNLVYLPLFLSFLSLPLLGLRIRPSFPEPYNLPSLKSKIYQLDPFFFSFFLAFPLLRLCVRPPGPFTI